MVSSDINCSLLQGRHNLEMGEQVFGHDSRESRSEAPSPSGEALGKKVKVSGKSEKSGMRAEGDKEIFPLFHC